MKRFTAYLFWLQNAFHLHLLMQDQSSSAMQQPLGGVFSLTCEYHVRSTVCVSASVCSSTQVAIQRQVLWFLHKKHKLRPSCSRPRYTTGCMLHIQLTQLIYSSEDY